MEKIKREPIHVMTKPIGPICNLDCEYCFYLRKEDLYPEAKSWRMKDETLRQYIQQYIESYPPRAPEITFAWQGGEPTMLGVDFFRRVVEIQKEFGRPGTKISNSLQTNGTLLDDEWCELFKQHDFLIGLSIDGPAEFHDRYRFDKKGEPTFSKVMQALRLLQKHRVEFNALVVVNQDNGAHGKRIYQYLRDSGCTFMQFIPLVEHLDNPDDNPDDHVDGHVDGHVDLVQLETDPEKQRTQAREPAVSPRSVGAAQWGEFLVEVFDEWIKRDVSRIFVQIFDQSLSAWLGVEPSLCVFRKHCGRALAIEHNGDLYSCDHFVDPPYLLGNIADQSLLELANSPQQIQFGLDKETTLPRQCLECEVRFVCNGECPKNRIRSTAEGEPGLNYLCAGYYRFFTHIDKPMKQMAQFVQQRKSPANIMQANAGSKGSGRNDLCPCGSGKKYKRCCMGKGVK